MGWRQWLSLQGKREETTPRTTLLREVHMTIAGWHEHESDDALRRWHHPHGGVLSLAMVNRDAIPPLSRIDLLRNSFRRMAESGGGGLIEADVIQSPYGPAARTIYKKRQRLAFMFTGMLLLPADAEWLVCTAVDAEQGATGVREAVVTAQLLEAGDLTVEGYEQSWAQDPYDPDHERLDGRVLRYMSDDERYDAQFPDHPLSRVRRTLGALLENVFMSR